MPSRPILFKAVTFGVAAIALAGIALAWQWQQQVTAHPGEEALTRFAPSRTALAVSLDWKPRSFEQGQVLQRLNAALDREQLKDRIASKLHELSNDAPFIQELVPHLTGNGAAALWSKDGVSFRSDQIAGFIAFDIDSSQEIEAILKRYAERSLTVAGSPVYIIRSLTEARSHQTTLSRSQTTADVKVNVSRNDNPGYFTLRGSYLLLADSEATLEQMRKVEAHTADALMTNPEYKPLRGSVPAEANLFCYVSSTLARETQRQAAHSTTLPPSGEAFAFSATLRKGGIALDSVMLCRADYAQPLSRIASIEAKAALPIPPHALAFTVLSQPSKYIEVFEGALQSIGGETYASYEKSRTDFERQTGLSLHSDILPATNGQWILAAYPGPQSNSIDLLLLADNSHEATPARFADDLRTVIESQDSHLHFARRTEGNVTRWTLPSSWGLTSIGGDAPKETGGDKATQINGSFLVATSSGLLDRAISAYDTPSLSVPDLQRIPGGTKALLVLQTTEILAMLKPSMEEWQRQSTQTNPLSAADMESLFGTAPLIATAGYQNNQFNSSLLVPLNYDSLPHVGRKAWDSLEQPQP
jgi:hypothetical protein